MKKITILVISILIIVSTVFIYKNLNTTYPTTFEECVKQNGGAIMKSNPPQCWVERNGKTIKFFGPRV